MPQSLIYFLAGKKRTLRKERINVKEEQDGHKGISETMDVYGHLFPDAKNKVAARLDAFAIESEEYEKVELNLFNLNA